MNGNTHVLLEHKYRWATLGEAIHALLERQTCEAPIGNWKSYIGHPMRDIPGHLGRREEDHPACTSEGPSRGVHRQGEARQTEEAMTDWSPQEIRILMAAGFTIDPKTGMFTHNDLSIPERPQIGHLMRDPTGHLGNRRERRAAAARARRRWKHLPVPGPVRGVILDEKHRTRKWP